MTQQATTLDLHLANFDKQRDQLPGRGVPWLDELREEAIAAYEELGWPTTEREEWKYTSLEKVRKLDLRPAPRLEPGTIDAADLAGYTFDGADTIQLVFVNGHLDEELSDTTGLPEGVTVGSLAATLEEDPERLEGHLGEHANHLDHAFCALNTASFTDGAYIEVPDGTTVETPIHVLYVSRPEETPTISHPRTLVVAGESAQVDVVETFLGTSEGDVVTNAVTEIEAGANATVRHVKLQREQPDTHHFWEFQAAQARDSTIRSHNLIFGGEITRSNVFNLLDGEGCDTTLNGLYLGVDEQHIDNYTQIRHAQPHGTSHQLYKGILDDDSRGVFRGTIYVAPGAQKTDGYQHNPNLLLSPGSTANSVPQLEIFADDVKCSHGSTTGELEEEWIFYMRTRGLNADEARDLLVYAFAGEVIEMIELDPVRTLVEELVLERLERGTIARETV